MVLTPVQVQGVVVCAGCGAPEHVPCKTRHGNQRDPHNVRRKAAEALYEKWRTP